MSRYVMTTTKSRGCEGKKARAARRAAQEHMQRLINDEGASPAALNVYRCRFGSHWHVGHLGRRGVER
jgi:hypothetical protein